MKFFTIGTKYWLGNLKPPADVGTDKPKNQHGQTPVNEHEKAPSVGQLNAVLDPIKPTRHHVGSMHRTSSSNDRKSLKRLSQLRQWDVFDVNVGLHGCFFVQNRTLAKQLFRSRTNCPLYSLGATLPGCGLTLQHLKEISKLMDKHKHSLERVSLVMPKSGYGNFFVTGDLKQYTESRTKLTFLFRILPFLLNLKTFKLNINESAFLDFDQTLTALAKTVRHMPKLRELSLGISRNSFPDRVMEEFFYNLTYQDKLESLALNISRSTRITDRTLCDAWTHVKEIISLKKLTINVSHIDNCDDKVIAHLSRTLLDLKELKEVNLKINATPCTTESIVILLNDARELEHLQRLTIHAAGCQAIDQHHARQQFTDFAAQRDIVANINFIDDKPEFGLKGPA